VTKYSQIGIAICVCACVMALSGCVRQQRDSDANALGVPNIEGDKIIFLTNAPQLAYLRIEPAQELKAAVIGLNGRLMWDDDVTARVFPSVSGRIVEICADLGQHISAGDALAKIRSPDFGQAQADGRKAIADLKVAECALYRTRELLEHGAAARKDLEAAEADYTRALSEKDRALATLSVYGGNGDSVDGVFALKAPIDGVIVQKSVNPGQEVRSDQTGTDVKPLFVITDPSRLWALLDATEQDLTSLRPGTEIKLLTQTYPGQRFDGRIEVIPDLVDPDSRTIKVRATIENSRRLLKAQMFVSAELPSPPWSGVEVPSQAVFLLGGKRYVFVQNGLGSYQRQEVSTGPDRDGHTLVTTGLQVGKNVVTDGGLLLYQILAENL